ncbi:MAG: hypothetical protein ACI4WU_03770, partial [Bacilli bacterium]
NVFRYYFKNNDELLDKIDNSNVFRYYFKNNDELIDKIDDIIVDGDTILIKGSHGMNLLEIVEYLKK